MAKHNCELNFLSRSDGSALYSLGSTVVLASVNGPGDVKKSNRLHNRAHLEINFSPCTGHSMIGERVMESLITKTVEQVVLVHMHPRTAINLTIQEMQSDGLTLCTSINAACLALLDAGIQMKNTFAAVTCCSTPQETILIDPTEAELKECVAVATFVFDSSLSSVLSAHQEGRLNADNFNRCLVQCKVAAKDVFNFYRQTLEKKYKNDVLG